jgi:transcriptional regulator with GAF, ATPase, and Fis domain
LANEDRALYKNTARHDKPFVKVNCAALPKELVESELFSHEKGAFTLALDIAAVPGLGTADYTLKTMRQAEADAIYQALKHTRRKIRGKNGAAALLEIPPSTLEYRMKRAGVTKDRVIGKKTGTPPKNQ